MEALHHDEPGDTLTEDMDAGDPSSIDALLAAAHRQFAGSLPAKVADLEEHVARADWTEARRAAHKLRGSAATYGFPELAASASAIEEALLGVAEPGDELRARVAAHLVQAREQAERAAGAAR
ncbi:MAG TPA: Hpt domain-containing protein [Polyangiaceae bacterium]|jgi:HPt (histidine-containing phosphotransfer) domain-containing protein